MVWNFVQASLINKAAVVLLYVLESNGSSPGRQGFTMAVNQAGHFEGTIGGGIMEVKLIEFAKHELKKGHTQPTIKIQHHNKSVSKNQSGLICSGTQTVAIVPLLEKDLPTIETILKRREAVYLSLDKEQGLQLSSEAVASDPKQKTEAEFSFSIVIPRTKVAHIFGAGHVGLALARQLSILGYRIIHYDDRADLHTLQKNTFSDEIKIIDYEKLADDFEAQPDDAVIIVSFSYRTDKIILKQLYDRPFAYIGMMGSDNKIDALKNELAKEGITAKMISHVFMPIGLNIYSKTAAEIAVSIASQIIFEQNKKLPTGRNYDA